MNKLNYYGIKGTELQWFHSYLTNRSQYVEFEFGNGKSSSQYIYADATPVTPVPVSHTNFNDGDPSYSPTCISTINSKLAKVNDWLTVNKLSLSVKKNKYMFFSQV